MKKTIALALSLILVLVSLSCFAESAGGPKFVTVREWLDAKGECGDCMLLLKVKQMINPVLALAADETGTVNLYSGANAPESFVAFLDEEKGNLEGYTLVIANPKYNPFEGTIEMAEWTLLRILPVID